MWQLFIASFCDQTEIEGNGRNNNNKTTWQMARSLRKQALLKLKNILIRYTYRGIPGTSIFCKTDDVRND